MRHACVTTFSNKGFETYGRKFLETYVKHWNVPLWVYYENPKPDFEHELVTWLPLDIDEERADFIKRHGKRPAKTYRHEIARFSHKIFALTDPKRLDTVDTDWWIWLDADIETIAPVDDAFLSLVCPDAFRGSYLGRKDWDHSECGFVSYNMRNGGRGTLDRFRQIYVSDEILKFDQWHDSFIFDQIRQGWWYNLSSGIAGRDVFDSCLLSTKLVHKKGNRKIAASAAKAAAQPRPGPNVVTGGQNLIVKTKNCVSDPNILANIHYSMTLMQNWLMECEPHQKTAVFCSGGPSLKNHIEEIRELSQRPDHIIVCVKHAQDILLEEGIVPWGCILLDPRAHVQDFIQNPHPQVRYLAASMVHPTTVDRLIEKSAILWGYHAMVGAGELEVVRQRGGKHFLISGGCSSAMRGVAVLRVLGFRRFKLYAYDLCFLEKPDMTQLTDKGEPKYLEVEINGRKFWTDAEKVAQFQDFQQILVQGTDMEIEVCGDGMVAHSWQTSRRVRPRFEDMFDG